LPASFAGGMPFDKLLKRATRGSRSSSPSESTVSFAASSEELERAEALGVREWVVPRAALQLQARIGKGSFGCVHRCNLEDQEQYVAKQISPLRTKSEDMSCLVNEMQVWSSVKHPHCVAFRGVVFGRKEHDDYFLIGEFMPGGTVHERLVRSAAANAPPPKRTVLNSEMLQIASAMEYLHSLDIIHRDLKSSNVLIGKDGRLVVGDFGLARYARPDGEMTAETGSYRWMAPEVIRHERYSHSCDVYSYGMLCYELLTHRVPYNDTTAVSAALRVARSGIRPDLPPTAPHGVCDIIQCCWQQDPHARPSFATVCTLLEARGASLAAQATTDHSKHRPPTVRVAAGDLTNCPSPPKRTGAACATLDLNRVASLTL